jgi:hypothetical protein
MITEPYGGCNSNGDAIIKDMTRDIVDVEDIVIDFVDVEDNVLDSFRTAMRRMQ